MLAASNNQVAAPARTQLMNTAATVIAFRPHADGETADVVVEVLYPANGHADILRGVTERDGLARGWTHVHRADPAERASLHTIGEDGKPRIYNEIRRPEFWSVLIGNELLGPNTGSCRRPLNPFEGGDLETEISQAARGYQGKRYEEMGPFERMLHFSDRVIAAADQAVYGFWNHHPSSCPIRELEAHVRGEDVVRRQPILSRTIELFEDAIQRSGITEQEAKNAHFYRTLHNSLKPTETIFHVTISRDGPENWVIQDVVAADPADEDEHYYGDSLFLPNRSDLSIVMPVDEGGVIIRFS